MEMTIEEHIVQLKKLKSFHNGSYGANINFAIDTMRKYQKIVDIVSLNGEEFKQCGLKELKEILEVIADGAINSSDCIQS